ncbi:hypothetical protein KUTeg_014685 [Tegillarca granosa]|uniref:Rhophilin-2 n=1 Tax=Tegillarca granosa TaxID=220873 RepID=A0ABQ9ERA5_TEGGR|nr:hypothetical protein KUTeg_014685 [Tegillarca granosa]
MHAGVRIYLSHFLQTLSEGHHLESKANNLKMLIAVVCLCSHEHTFLNNLKSMCKRTYTIMNRPQIFIKFDTSASNNNNNIYIQDRSTENGVKTAVHNFQKAAGTFRYLHNHFSNPPSMDMQPQTLTMLIQLMMSQAQESVFDGVVNAGKTEGILGYMKIAQEAIVVSQMYDDTHLLMSTEPVKDYIPYSWISMALVKSQYYKALAHDYMAFGILDQKGKAHLKESLICHEEALRFHDLCKQLRKIDTFQEILKKAHDRALEKFSSLEEEDDFTEVVLSPVIHAKTDQPVLPLAPEFSKVTVTDIFKTLGPISIFNAKNEWSVPRTVVLEKSTTQGFGFSVRGDSPVIVADIETGSVAEKSKLKVGDFVVAVGGKDTKWSKHEEVVKMVRQYGNHIELKVITPLNVLETTRRSSASSSPGTPAKMQSPRDSVSSHSVKSNRSRLSAPWIFMRKGSREKPDKIERSKEVEDGDIFLR